MEYYDSELLRLKQEVMEKEKINAQLGDLLLQQAELKNKAEELKKIMWEEQEDVDGRRHDEEEPRDVVAMDPPARGAPDRL